eukprot:m.213849 g.213849  ORF g.213849 m.213849 type:complete len:114 (-) comp54047_c0_seq1:1229-1570(-)
MFPHEDAKQLMRAVENNVLTECQLIVQKWGTDIITAPYFRWTPLHWSVFHNHLQILQYFLQQGANCNSLTSVRMLGCGVWSLERLLSILLLFVLLWFAGRAIATDVCSWIRAP